MKCPYCGEEMIRGYLMSSRDITFAVDNVEPTRSKADVVINSGKNDVEFDLFVSKVGQLLEEREKEN